MAFVEAYGYTPLFKRAGHDAITREFRVNNDAAIKRSPRGLLVSRRRVVAQRNSAFTRPADTGSTA
jgi:hypothetical protein